MADTMTTGAPAPDPTTQAIGNIETALSAAPELTKAPGVALDVANGGGDVPGNSQAISALANRQPRAAAAQQVNQASGGGLFGVLGSLGHDVAHIGGDVIGGAVKVANTGLQAMQHEWRYLHDVEAKHGLLAALGEGLVIVGAAAAGAVLTGGAGDVAEAGILAGAGEAATAAAGEGAAAGAAGAAGVAGEAAGEAGVGAGEAAAGAASRGAVRAGFHVAGKVLNMAAPARVILPGEAAGYAMAHVLYGDSWKKTADPNYRDPHTGELVNFGNDVAGWFGIKGGARTALSGASNAIFDLALDPLASAGKVVGQARSAEGLTLGIRGGPTKTWARNLLPENIERLAVGTDAQSRNYQRLAQYLADSNAGQIIAFDRRLTPLVADTMDETGRVIRPGLANASTPDEVTDVFRHHQGMMQTTSTTLPSMSLLRLKMTQLRQYMNDGTTTYLHPVLGGLRHPTALRGNIGKLTTRVPGTSFDAASRKFVKSSVNFTSMAGADLLRDWYEMGLGRTQANSLIDLMYHSDVATRHIIHRNASLMTLLGHAGLDFGNPDVTDASWYSTSIEHALNQINKPKVREALQRRIDSLMSPTSPDAGGVYNSTRSGEPTRPFIDPETGKRMQGASLLSQTGEVPLPSYSEIHHIAQKLSGGQRFTGAVDDFLMNHVTDPIFKRWILQSYGYALHISAAEMIPNTLRLGFQTMARASYYTALARLSNATERDSEELSGMTKIAYDLLDGHPRFKPVLAQLKQLQKVKNVTAAEALRIAPKAQAEMDKVMDWIRVTNAHLVTPGLAPHGGIVDTMGDDSVGKAVGGFRGLMARTRWKRGDNYTTYGPPDAEHVRSWRVHLGLQAKDPIARAAARAMHEAYRQGHDDQSAYARGVEAAHEALQRIPADQLSGFIGSTLKRDGDPAAMTPLESWAHVVTEDVAAMTHDGTDAHAPNMVLLKNVADGHPTLQGVLHKIPVDLRPRNVPGREIVPSGASFWARLSSIGYERVLNPTVNFLSRQPLAYAEFSKRMDLYQHLEDTGVMLHEERVIRAAGEATVDAIRYIHNIQDRTQLDQLLRNWVPFFFAQEQAYRRAGRFLAEDPGAFRRYQLGIAAVHDMVTKQQDQQGNQVFAFPGAGWLDRSVVGALGIMGMQTASLNPTGFGGTLSAANVVFPVANGVRPDLSPVVTLGAHAVHDAFEEFGRSYATFEPVISRVDGALTAAVGSQAMSQNVLQQLIPNTTAYRAVETLAANDTAFTSAFLMTLQNLAYQQNVAMQKWVAGGQKGPMPDIIPPPNADPNAIQAFLSKVKNQTRIVFMMRAIIGAVSPVSADVTVDDFGLNAKLQADIKGAKSVALGFQKFLHDNPNATPYVVSKSTTATGSSLPDTQAALDWIAQHKITDPNSTLGKYQYGAMWLMPRPTDAKYSAQAYLNEIADGLRVRDTPEQYLKALYTENGNQTYYAALNIHEQAVQAATGNSGALSQEYAKWGAYMQTLQKQQPIWWAAYNGGTRQSDAQRSINELQDIFAKGLAPAGQQSDDIGSLLADYQNAEQAYMQAGTLPNYSSAQKKIRDQWIIYVNQLAQDKPNLAGIISSVFREALTYTNVA